MNLMLLPGMDGTGELFEPLVPTLPDTINPIVVSYPGDQKLGYSDLIPFVKSQIPADEPYVVLGESFSGPIATSIAADNDDHLRGLIFAASFIRNPSAALALLKRFVPFVSTHSSPARFVRNILLGTDRQDIKDLAERSLSKVDPDVVRFRMLEIEAVDAGAALARVDVPILYLRASDDRLVFPRSSRAIAKIQPGAQITTIIGPHLLLQSQPRECADSIDQFVERCRGR
ncbi:MAG: alpha/beta hydrolase [Pseudomonadota bacterium]